MTAAWIIGGLFGASLCLLAVAIVAPRPSLARQAARFENARASGSAARPGSSAKLEDKLDATFEAWEGRLGKWLVTQLWSRGMLLKDLRANLEITDGSLETHLARKAIYTVGGFLLPVIVAPIWAVLRIPVPLPTALMLGLILAVIGFWYPDSRVKERATARREELRFGLACYLTWVSQSLSGGIGLPDAVRDSADLGTGWAFDLIRNTLQRARLNKESPWVALADLGDRTGTYELQDLGGALQLAAGDGAKVRTSLASRAKSMRDKILADTEAAAQKADSNMSVAQVVLVCGLLLFLGFPAMSSILKI